MVENIAGMRVEGTMVAGAGSRCRRPPMQRVAVFGAVAAMLAVTLIFSPTTGRAYEPCGDQQENRCPQVADDAALFRVAAISAPTAPRAITSEQARFLEVNTTMLPNAVTADVRPAVVTSAQQRFLEVNTTALSEGASNYAEEVTPTIGHPR